MPSAQIKQCAASVRAALEGISAEERPIGFKLFPRGACGDASLVLAAILRDEGLGNFRYVCGLTHNDIGNESHAWLCGEGLIVDITADQFNDGMPPVFVEPESDWHNRWEDVVEQPADYREWHGHGLDDVNRVYRLVKDCI